MDKQERMKEIQEELKRLPKGTVTYKHIHDKDQPYLQWYEGGRCRSVYIKLKDRHQVLTDIEKRKNLETELRLLEKYTWKVAQILSKAPSLEGAPCIGSEDFMEFRAEGVMYVDKTKFIKEWWEAPDKVTLITRPRRFGKSLMLSTIESFFSIEKKEMAEKLFDDLFIMKQPGYDRMFGTYPVIRLSFAAFKSGDVEDFKLGLTRALRKVFMQYKHVISFDQMPEHMKNVYDAYIDDFTHNQVECVTYAVNDLCNILYECFGKKTVILIDEYDAPVQAAFLKGKWEEMSDFYCAFMISSIKCNDKCAKVLITGVTSVAVESFFSDTNNIVVRSVLSDAYSDSFGFTEEEVFAILECRDPALKKKVKEMYDGFTFGNTNNIYNPWSVLNYLSEKKLKAFWTATGGTALASKITLAANNSIKDDLYVLMMGGCIRKKFVEAITYQSLAADQSAVWPLLLASGCLTASNRKYDGKYVECDLRIPNRETWYAFADIVDAWMSSSVEDRNAFCKYLIQDDLDMMNRYMQDIVWESVSAFDAGTKPSEKAPERFYHGFVLGMLVDLREEYVIESNRESGLGRYDIMLMPKQKSLNGIVIEFKVYDEKKEKNLEETAQSALKQIEEKRYEQQLISYGVSADKIRKYGFAFEGKAVVILRGM